ncbi:hypothetical protein JKF63_07374 [Porcisia hertigi]|uniref:Monocarboxylate transporter-like protein n=1 Tax=Porcisia hertigi TaxID=2761500 RepID=A0A836YIQ5_9TRYP|nr:hypothetical protein JKF63_07374 [Porcisia hertigi]
MQFYKACKRANRVITHRPADHWIGYLVAISGALMQMMSYGIDNSYSIFSDSMQKDATLGFPSATTVSFGNSVSLGLSPVFGVFAGFLVDRVPPRIMMFLSTAMLFAALWLSSTYATSAAQVTASYSLLASISSAFMLSPGAAATGSWFQKRIGLGQGINFCGGGVGSTVIPAVLGSLVDVYGWRHTFRLMSAFCSIGVVGTILSCRRHPIEDDADEEGIALQSSNSNSRQPDKLGHEKVEGTSKHPGNTLGEGDAMRVSSSHADLVFGDSDSDPHSNGKADGRLPISANVVSPNYSEDMLNAMNGGGQQRNTALGDQQKGPRADKLSMLIEEMHTRVLTPKETLRVLFSARFLIHFFMFAIYGWAFYGLIYVVFPYVSSMGKAGTVYADVTPIKTAKASTAFTFWGVFQIFGSILIGAVGSTTDDAFAYTICSAVGGVATSLLVFCRSYASFAACLSVVGFCTAGIFAMMPALIARDFYGPNLGFFMGSVFVAGCLGGFSAPPIQAQLQTRYNGNYSYGCVFISCCMTAPGVLCYLFLWPGKKSFVGRLFNHLPTLG